MTKKEAEEYCRAQNELPSRVMNCFPVQVTMMRLSDSLTVDFWTWLYGDGSPDDLMWAEGNYGCDCNREAFFGRALSPSWDEEVGIASTKCGEGAYRVRLRYERRVFYDDFPGGKDEPRLMI